MNDLEWHYLEGDGDFKSKEIKKLRDEADIIITNPPFSLFREFLAWIVEADKLFVIIGSKNAITYKEVFPLKVYSKNAVIWDNLLKLGSFTSIQDTALLQFGRKILFTLKDSEGKGGFHDFAQLVKLVQALKIYKLAYFQNILKIFLNNYNLNVNFFFLLLYYIYLY